MGRQAPATQGDFDPAPSVERAPRLWHAGRVSRGVRPIAPALLGVGPDSPRFRAPPSTTCATRAPGRARRGADGRTIYAIDRAGLFVAAARGRAGPGAGRFRPARRGLYEFS